MTDTAARPRSLLWTAVIVGTVVALILFFASEWAFETGRGRLARQLLWQASFLQGLVPTPTFETPSGTIYEGTPVHLAAWYVGAILGAPLYAAATYVLLRFGLRKSAL